MTLADPPHELADRYDAVVVGSGYGGGVAASRLARAGRRVAVLERGRERGPGDFPASAGAAWREVHIDSPDGSRGDPESLYDVRRNEDMTVLVACGLGGGSLINAGVALQADDRVFADPCWPEELRVPGTLAQAYAQAREMLAPQPYPHDAPPKLLALQAGATAVGATFSRPPITVSFADGPNHVGVEQRACRECGDCVAGCNFRAKGSVDVTYLADARRHGAQIVTGVRVRRVSRAADGDWLVHYRVVGRGFGRFTAPDLVVRAQDVVLAAGTLGSTEILLRSRAAGLPLSDRLGQGFTANGDVLAFAYNCDRPVFGAGFGDDEDHPPVGPCITGLADLREGALEDGIVVEEGAMPRPLGPILAAGLLGARLLDGRDTDDGDEFDEVVRVLESLTGGGGAVDNTLVYLVMAHDGSSGRMRLAEDRLRVDWPTDPDESPLFRAVHRCLEKATAALGGTYVKNPTASPLLGQDSVTVHPLGGAGMGPDAERGVVDHAGRVYAGGSGTAVHEGLYVWDGAAVPRSLGVNPLLTITALAERCATVLAERRGWDLDRTLDPDPAPLPQRSRPRGGLRFTERMAGGFVTADGRTEDFALIVAVTIEDLDEFEADGRHRARLHGTVESVALHTDPLTVTDGTLDLLVADVVRPGDPHRPQPGTRRMVYRARLTAADGSCYHLLGEKLVQDDPGFDIWSDTTTLAITVRDGDADGPTVGHGVLKIARRDLARQITTLRATGGSFGQRMRVLSRFGLFFAGSLLDSYTRSAPPTLSPIRPYTLDGVPDAQVTIHDLVTEDQVGLRMVRFTRPGAGSAVLVTHGLTTSTDMFVMPEHRNLVTHLLDEGFDVWCLDTRLSNLYDYSISRSDVLDDCALFDFPPALAEIRRHTDAPVHVVAHCLGSTAFTMSLFGGVVHGIASVVANSVALTPRVPAWSRAKLAITPELLDRVRIGKLDPRWSEGSWFSAGKLIGSVVSLVHRECDEPACHMLSLMWGTGWPALFRHENMHPTTHHRLRDLFGATGTSHYRHVRAMVRAGRAVRYRPPEGAYARLPADYLSRASEITTPVLFSTGADNRVFADSNLVCHQLLAQQGATWHEHVSFTGYGHQDVFMGQDSARDVFPWMVDFLRRHDRR
ncbi:MAG: GMC family oxidoreductase N-terminal domain-containing protein [Pseudonocardia sp.]